MYESFEDSSMSLKKFSIALTVFLAMCLLWTTQAHAVRLKDIAEVEGVRGNQLFGYGLVVGLNGTGDGIMINFTLKSVANMLERSGLNISTQGLQVRNVASVMVTATLPPFARAGSEIDITVSSMGDAKSLQGGTLLMTSLRGPDGNVYAVAQGPLAVGGFSVEGGGDAAIKNHPTTGVIARGAIVERTIPFDLFQSKRVRIVLRQPDFTTMTRIVEEINQDIGAPLAVAIDSASVEVPLRGAFAEDPIGFVSRLEQIHVQQDTHAKVIVNERTGTIVMGENVMVDKVALAHGNLSIAIRSETQVSQPDALGGEGATTEVVTNADVQVGEDVNGLTVVGGKVSLGELVDALNALGATPRDLISIFSALQRAGALQAELEIM